MTQSPQTPDLTITLVGTNPLSVGIETPAVAAAGVFELSGLLGHLAYLPDQVISVLRGSECSSGEKASCAGDVALHV